MAKYDWKQLEKEYILSNYKSVSGFLKDKGIKRHGSTQKAVKGWNKKKVRKEFEKSSRIIEKVIEKESEKEAQQIVDVKSIANDLALNILKANKELNKYIDLKGNKFKGIIDRKGLKQLTSALKDINDILGNEHPDRNDRVQIINDLVEDKENE